MEVRHLRSRYLCYFRFFLRARTIVAAVAGTTTSAATTTTLNVRKSAIFYHLKAKEKPSFCPLPVSHMHSLPGTVSYMEYCRIVPDSLENYVMSPHLIT